MSLTVNLELAGDNISSSATAVSAGNVIEDANIFARAVTTQHLTAFATDISFVTEKQGGGAYEIYGVPFITNVTSSLPVTLEAYGTGGAGSVNVAVSAQGSVDGKGLNTLQYVVTLSSFALSGNGAGDNARVAVANTTVTVLPVVSAVLVPTPYATNPGFPPPTLIYSKNEAARKRLLGYI